MSASASEIVPFLYETEKRHEPVRVVMRDGAPWFAAADVARILGHRDALTAVRILDNDEKGTHIVRTLGGDQEILIISESGLYALILRSRKPTAKKFRRWVTGEILPAIRRTGGWGKTGGLSAHDLSVITGLLHQHQLRVLEAVRGLAAGTGVARASIGTIGEIAGLSMDSVYRAIALCSMLGLIHLDPDERLQAMLSTGRLH